MLEIEVVIHIFIFYFGIKSIKNTYKEKNIRLKISYNSL